MPEMQSYGENGVTRRLLGTLVGYYIVVEPRSLHKIYDRVVFESWLLYYCV